MAFSWNTHIHRPTLPQVNALDTPGYVRARPHATPIESVVDKAASSVVEGASSSAASCSSSSSFGSSAASSSSFPPLPPSPAPSSEEDELEEKTLELGDSAACSSSSRRLLRRRSYFVAMQFEGFVEHIDLTPCVREFSSKVETHTHTPSSPNRFGTFFFDRILI